MTKNQLLEALQQAVGGEEVEEGVYTMREIQRVSPYGRCKTRDIVRDLIETGQMEHVTIRRAGINRIVCPVDAYRVVDRPSG